MSQTSRILLSIFITAIIVGNTVYFWQTSRQDKINTPKQSSTIDSSEKTYSSGVYSFQYPQEYQVSEEGTGDTYILTVSKNEKTKLEIYRADKFPVDRAAYGFTGEETSEEADTYAKEVQSKLPKQYLTKGKYDVWLYHDVSDTTSEKELYKIYESIEIK